jgi:1-acyl-sn-glycerol-3-phosphate acyltransferase
MRILWIVYKLYFGFIFYGTLVLLYPAFHFLTGKRKYWPAAVKLEKFWGQMIMALTFVRLRAVGKENFPEPPFVVVSNHASYIDTVLMYGIVPGNFAFIGKGELLNWPLFARFFRSGLNIPVFRQSLKNAAQAMDLADQRIKDDWSIAIFPEGGILPEAPRIAPFRNGAFSLAIQNGVPVVPVLMANSYKIFESLDLFATSGRPGVARIRILEPIQTTELSDADIITLRERVRNTIIKAQTEYEDR